MNMIFAYAFTQVDGGNNVYHLALGIILLVIIAFITFVNRELLFGSGPKKSTPKTDPFKSQQQIKREDAYPTTIDPETGKVIPVHEVTVGPKQWDI